MTAAQYTGLYALAAVLFWIGYAMVSDFGCDPAAATGASLVWPLALLRGAFRCVRAWWQA